MLATELKAQIENLCRIGIALSSERDIDVLLEMIVDESRRFTRADAGTLYSVSEDGKHLDWKIVQNDSMETRIGGTSSIKVDKTVFPLVPLVTDGQVNLSNVSTYVANTGQAVNIPDVYEAEGFDFTGPRQYDEATGYRSRSMLVVPLRNHEDDNIGVLQLLNAQDSEKKVIPFSSDYENLVTSLASQAAIGITNARLIQDLENLFDSFIQTIAAAIDEKSPYTAGHVRRVVELTMMIAEQINGSKDGLWGKVRFGTDELNELRIAAWMHDVGKITTPEYVVDKSTKLETIYDRLETIRTRYEILIRDAEISSLKKKLEVRGGEGESDVLDRIEEEFQRQVSALREELAFITQCNTGGEFMADEHIDRLAGIAGHIKSNGDLHNRLTEDEVYNLSIRKGTLTEEERQIINNHAAVSIKMLTQLPFSKKLGQVPRYAGGHHEKLNGKGYPGGLTADQLPLQARIMAVADIFEALTAPDRPYRRPMPLSQALKIMGFMVKDQELDHKIVDLVVESGLALKYAKKELNADQVDVE